MVTAASQLSKILRKEGPGSMSDSHLAPLRVSALASSAEARCKAALKFRWVIRARQTINSSARDCSSSEGRDARG